MENDRERIKKDIMEIIEKDEEGWGGGTPEAQWQDILWTQFLKFKIKQKHLT